MTKLYNPPWARLEIGSNQPFSVGWTGYLRIQANDHTYEARFRVNHNQSVDRELLVGVLRGLADHIERERVKDMPYDSEQEAWVIHTDGNAIQAVFLTEAEMRSWSITRKAEGWDYRRSFVTRLGVGGGPTMTATWSISKLLDE